MSDMPIHFHLEMPENDAHPTGTPNEWTKLAWTQLDLKLQNWTNRKLSYLTGDFHGKMKNSSVTV